MAGVADRTGDDAPGAPARRARMRPAEALQATLSTVVVCLLAIALQVSVAAIIYQGPLVAFVDRAIAISLIGATVMGVASPVLFSYRGTITSPQNVTAVIVALAAASIAAGMADPSSERAFATVLAMVAVATLLSGAVAWLLGRFRLGVVARFMPYPVVTGFLAATGYMLVMGGIGVASREAVQIRNLGVLLEPGNPARWVPWALVSAAIVLLWRRLDRPLVLPIGLILSAVAFYLALSALGLGMDFAAREGLLLGPFDEGFLPAFAGWQPLAIDVRAVVAQTPTILSTVGICIISTVLAGSSVEAVTGTRVDPDRELRAVGACNLAGGLAGSPVGYHSMSLTLLAYSTGLTGRIGWPGAAACLLALTVGGPLVGQLPIGLFATIIIVIGANLILGALVDQRRSLPLADYAVVAIIPAITAVFGFLWGVAVGLLAAALFFITTFARIDVVRLATTGARLRSLLERPDAERQRLTELGSRVAVYCLEGYIFFGTAHRLAQRVEAALDRDPPPHHVLVDFRRVRGVDTSAARALTRLDAACRARGVALTFTGLDAASDRLIRGQLTPDGDLRFADRLEQALEEVEAELLLADPPEPGAAPGFLDALRERHPSVDLGAYFLASEVPAGAEVITQGAASDDLLVLRSGMLRTEVSGTSGAPVTVARCLPGALVGEIGLYAGVPRTARVVAEEPSEVLRIDSAALARMGRDHPTLLADFHRLIAATLARRLSRTTALLADSDIQSR